MSLCFRPKPCCFTLCDHPPDCDHKDHGVTETPWQPVWYGSEIRRWIEGAEWCAGCGWWLRETAPPEEVTSDYARTASA